jgi:hypothetical protein
LIYFKQNMTLDPHVQLLCSKHRRAVVELMVKSVWANEAALKMIFGKDERNQRALKALLKLVVKHFFANGQVWGYVQELSRDKFERSPDSAVLLRSVSSASTIASGAPSVSATASPATPSMRRMDSISGAPSAAAPSPPAASSRRRSVSLSQIDTAANLCSPEAPEAAIAVPCRPMPRPPGSSASSSVAPSTTPTVPQKDKGMIGTAKEVVSLPSTMINAARDAGAPTPTELLGRAKEAGSSVTKRDLKDKAQNLRTAASKASLTSSSSSVGGKSAAASRSDLVHAASEFGAAVGTKSVGVGAELGSNVADALRGKSSTDQIPIPSLVAVALWEPEKYRRVKEVECFSSSDKPSQILQYGMLLCAMRLCATWCR